MLHARPGIAYPAAQPAPPGARLAPNTAAASSEALAGHTFHASCRPQSWSLFGVHLRLGVRRGIASPPGQGPAPSGTVAMRGEEAAAGSLVLAAQALGSSLGSGRVWLWCAGQVPSSRFLTLLAGHACLSDVGRARLGVELNAHALDGAGAAEIRRLDDLRAAGIAVLVRLDVRSGPAPEPDPLRLERLKRAHALGCSVLASGVTRRECARPLGEAGFAALSGPVVCNPTDLAGVLKFIGPVEPWLARMRADAL